MKKLIPVFVFLAIASAVGLVSERSQGREMTFWNNVGNVLWNPTQFKKMEQETNYDGLLLQTLTAAGAGTVTSADQENVNGRCLTVVVSITAITGTTPTLTVTVQGRDPVSGAYYTLLTSAALNAVATTPLYVCPGTTEAANTRASVPAPRTWRTSAVIAGTTPAVTATIAAGVTQ